LRVGEIHDGVGRVLFAVDGAVELDFSQEVFISCVHEFEHERVGIFGAICEELVFGGFEVLDFDVFGLDFEDKFFVLFFEFVEVVYEFGVFFGPFVDLIVFPEDCFFVGFVDLKEGFFEVNDLFGDLIDVFIILLCDFEPGGGVLSFNIFLG
jgi:hypothetical protein